jgi:hypothetical protein
VSDLLPTTWQHLPCGDERQAAYTDDGELDPIGGDLRDEITRAIDGDQQDEIWARMGQGLSRILAWICADEREQRVSPHDVGVRAIALRKLVCQLGAERIEHRHGVSKQSVSQSIALLRAALGDIPTLRTRGPDARRNMAEAAREAWRRRKEKRSPELPRASGRKDDEQMPNLPQPDDIGAQVNRGGTA